MPVVFLDRDGTLNRERGFVTSPEELEVLPGTRAALESLRAAGFRIAVLTNQSGIARGLLTEEDLSGIHQRLRAELPGLLDAVLHCPHHPDAPLEAFRAACACRKPNPGMLLRAAADLEARLEDSFLVGDTARDLLTGRGTAVRTVLVRTGTDPGGALAELVRQGAPPHHVARDLPEAAGWILAQAGWRSPQGR